MTDDEIQNLANAIWAAGETYIGPSIHNLRAFAYLVSAVERERCAKMCEAYAAAGIGREMAEAIRGLK